MVPYKLSVKMQSFHCYYEQNILSNTDYWEKSKKQSWL